MSGQSQVESRPLTGRVEKCGCTALPEHVQQGTGLYPGATFRIEVAANGRTLHLQVLESKEPGPPDPGTHC
jgi:hypothetical protein